MKTFSQKAAAIAALGSLAALMATGAQAHAHLVTAVPAASAAVAGPVKLHLTFSEALTPKFSKAVLSRADGAAVAVKSVAKGKAIDAAPVAPLTPGDYKVTWQAVASDGHKMTGEYSFTVK